MRDGETSKRLFAHPSLSRGTRRGDSPEVWPPTDKSFDDRETRHREHMHPIFDLILYVATLAGLGALLWIGTRHYQVGVNTIDDRMAEVEGLERREDGPILRRWWVLAMTVSGTLALWNMFQR